MSMLSDDDLAQILWDYNCLEQPLTQADCILVLGSKDIRVAHRGAELWHQDMAPLIIFSGNVGALTKATFARSEAEVFAEVAMQLGVPAEYILLETESTNTGQNITFSRKLIAERGLDIKSIILVQKPYMLRRAYATFKKQWPGQDFMVTGPQISFKDYPNHDISKELVINIMVGDTQRIKFYPALGFQIEQEMPASVWDAYEELVRRGYDKHLVP